MTRINCVPVEALTDNFLMAEYFELPRVFLLVHRHMQKGRTPDDLDIPPTYRMGTGHVAFFYDKLFWLARRFEQLRMEAHRRSLDVQRDPTTAGLDLPSFKNTSFWGDWSASREDMQLNLDRLQIRRRYQGGMYT